MISAPRKHKPVNAFPLMLTGVVVSTVIVLGFRFVLQPYLKQKKYDEAKMFADSLWEMQHSPKDDS